MAALETAKLLHAVTSRRLATGLLLVAALGGTLQSLQWGVSAWAASEESYWQRAREGWFWYEDPPVAPPPTPREEQPDKPSPRPDPSDPADPEVRERLKRWPVEEALLPRLPVKWLRALQDAKLERVLEDFTPEAAREYIVVHQEHFRRSKEFAELWRLVLVTNPELDPERLAPVSTAGLQVADALDREARAGAFAAWRGRAGLYFFFRSDCPYCQRFAPILKLFADTHGWTVFPVTRDGKPVPEFPDAAPDNGMGEALGVTTVPALYLAIPDERLLTPVSHGFLTLTQLEDRVLTVLKQQARLRARS